MKKLGRVDDHPNAVADDLGFKRRINFTTTVPEPVQQVELGEGLTLRIDVTGEWERIIEESKHRYGLGLKEMLQHEETPKLVVGFRSTSNSRGPGQKGNVRRVAGKMVQCVCGHMRYANAEPHSPQSIGIDVVADCQGQVWTKRDGRWVRSDA